MHPSKTLLNVGNIEISQHFEGKIISLRLNIRVIVAGFRYSGKLSCEKDSANISRNVRTASAQNFLRIIEDNFFLTCLVFL